MISITYQKINYFPLKAPLFAFFKKILSNNMYNYKIINKKMIKNYWLFKNTIFLKNSKKQKCQFCENSIFCKKSNSVNRTLKSYRKSTNLGGTWVCVRFCGENEKNTYRKNLVKIAKIIKMNFFIVLKNIWTQKIIETPIDVALFASHASFILSASRLRRRRICIFLRLLLCMYP